MDVSKYKVNFLIETVRREDISDEIYFSEGYKHYVSNSRLSYINPAQDGSPTKYRDGIKQSFNSSFDFGSAVHGLFLQPNEFTLSGYAGKPTAKLGVFIEQIYKSRKKGHTIIDSINIASVKADYYAGKLSPKILTTAITKGLPYYLEILNGLYDDEQGREVIVLSRKQQDDCKSCLKSLNENSKLKNALFGQNFFDSAKIYNEDALFIDVQVILPDGRDIILPLKTKLDNYKIDDAEKIIYLNDLKTSGKNVDYFMGGNAPEWNENHEKIGEYWINGSFQKYHYYRQIAFYLMVLQMYCKSIGYEGYRYKANMAVVQSLPEFKSKLYSVADKYITLGLAEFKELICRVAFHELNGYDIEFKED